MSGKATQDYSKRQRIINALAVYPDRYEFNADVVAELTDASESYVYRFQRQIDDSDIRDSEFSDDLIDDLQASYRDEIEALLDDREVERSIDNEGGGDDGDPTQEQRGEQQPTTEDNGAAENGTSEATEALPSDGRQRAHAAGAEAVPEESTVVQLRAVRETLAHHRKEAEFGRENFEGPAVDVAHGKYYVANNAIERLDDVIDDIENS